MLNETKIGDIWLLFSDYIDQKQIELAAERYVELLADYGVNDKVFQLASGNDAILDHAIACYLDIDEDEIIDDYVDDLEF